MAATDIIFTGLINLEGRTVSCAIGGLDCGDFKVLNGQITVPLSSNASLSSSFLAAIDALELTGSNMCFIRIGEVVYRVPVVIGRSFTTQGQMFRALSQEDVKSPSGGGLGKLRRGHQYSFLFVGSGPCSVGTDFNSMYTTHLKLPDNQTDWPGTRGFSGVHREALLGATDFDTMLTWQCNRPVPCTVAAAAVHQEVEEVE